MKKLHREEQKEKRRKAAMERHARLSNLFKEDRLSFERERKKMIDETINGVENEEHRNRLWAFQESWDKKMRSAGSAHNRLVLAQTFFWEHFYEVWLPAIQSFKRT